MKNSKKHSLFALLQANSQRAAYPITSKVNAKDPNVTDIYVYDVIDADWGASAKDLIIALNSTTTNTIHLHINSPGGDVFEARAMITALKGYQGQIVSYIDGLAASAASYLALSAAEVNIADGAFFMIHKAWMFSMGNADEFAKSAELLNKVDGSIAAEYAKKTGKPVEDMMDLMAAETWFTSEEAKAMGFADAITSDSSTSNRASFDVSAYLNAPEQLKNGQTSPNNSAAIDASAQQHWDELNRRATLYQRVA